MKNSEILIKTKEKIYNPENWTKGTNARDAKGNRVPANSAKATCWCIYGALAAVVSDFPEQNSAVDVLRAVVPSNFYGIISMFNDSRNTSHSEVMEVFDKAITVALREELTMQGKQG